MAHLFNLFRLETEQEEIVLTDSLTDLDVGTVECADRHGAVHHELHVARTRRFLARRRYLFRQVCGRADDLHRGDVVVRVEHQAQAPFHHRVRINHPRYVIDALDDVFRHRVTGRCFAANDDDSRHEIVTLATTNPVIQVNCVQDIE